MSPTPNLQELMTKIKPGVVTGDDLMTLLAFARDNEFAIPAVNVTSSSLICSCLEAAAKAKSPMIIQVRARRLLPPPRGLPARTRTRLARAAKGRLPPLACPSPTLCLLGVGAPCEN